MFPTIRSITFHDTTFSLGEGGRKKEEEKKNQPKNPTST